MIKNSSIKRALLYPLTLALLSSIYPHQTHTMDLSKALFWGSVSVGGGIVSGAVIWAWRSNANAEKYRSGAEFNNSAAETNRKAQQEKAENDRLADERHLALIQAQDNLNRAEKQRSAEAVFKRLAHKYSPLFTQMDDSSPNINGFSNYSSNEQYHVHEEIKGDISLAETNVRYLDPQNQASNQEFVQKLRSFGAHHTQTYKDVIERQRKSHEEEIYQQNFKAEQLKEQQAKADYTVRIAAVEKEKSAYIASLEKEKNSYKASCQKELDRLHNAKKELEQQNERQWAVYSGKIIDVTRSTIKNKEEIVRIDKEIQKVESRFKKEIERIDVRLTYEISRLDGRITQLINEFVTVVAQINKNFASIDTRFNQVGQTIIVQQQPNQSQATQLQPEYQRPPAYNPEWTKSQEEMAQEMPERQN